MKFATLVALVGLTAAIRIAAPGDAAATTATTATGTAATTTAAAGGFPDAACAEGAAGDACRKKKADAAAAMHPVGRVGRAEEIAAAVLYLCSEGASFTTGIALPVDGGSTCI